MGGGIPVSVYPLQKFYMIMGVYSSYKLELYVAKFYLGTLQNRLLTLKKGCDPKFEYQGSKIFQTNLMKKKLKQSTEMFSVFMSVIFILFYRT